MGFVLDSVALGEIFLRIILFPLTILIPLNAPRSSINRGWYNRPASVQRTKCTQTHPHATNFKIRTYFRSVSDLFQADHSGRAV
jgi:hypothetical protein